MTIRVEHGTNPNDRSCDGCGCNLPTPHVKITAESPGQNRVIDLCHNCVLVLSTQAIQSLPVTPDFKETT